MQHGFDLENGELSLDNLYYELKSILTELYLSGVITTGMLIGGLLTGSGIGILVLFKVNKDKKENLFILLSIYLIGVLIGIFLDLIKFGL